MVVNFKIFRSDWDTWAKLFESAASFASDVGPDRLIGISHSESPQGSGVVTVWYWDKAAYDPELS